MATSTISFSSWKTNSGTLKAEAPLLSAGDSSLANIIPNYSALQNVTLSFQWRTDKSLTAGDCWVYAGGSEWHGETNAKNSWVTVTCDKNNLSSILSFFNSATQNVGIPNDRIYIKFKASIMRNFYIRNASLVADYTPSVFLVDVLADGAGGSTSGTGNYTVSTSGTTFTISADPFYGYKFVRWSDENTEASRTITLYESQATGFQTLITYTAYFEKEKYTITANASDGGTVTGGGIYNYLDTITLTPTPDPGYRFVKWSDEDTSNPNPRTITVTGNATYTAIFEKIKCKLFINITPLEGGIVQLFLEDGTEVTGQTEFDYGTVIDFVITPNEGYLVDTSEGTVKSITIIEDYTNDVKFKKIKYTLNISISPSEGGEVNGKTSYEYGDMVEIQAISKPGYKFSQWIIGNQKYYEPTIKYKIKGIEDNTVQLVQLIFEKKVLNIITPSPDSDILFGGKITGGGTYYYGDEVKITAIPSEGYKFSGWAQQYETNPVHFIVTDAELDRSPLYFTPYFVPLELKFKSVKIYYPTGVNVASPENPLIAGEKAQIVVKIAME